MAIDLLIKNGTVVSPVCSYEADVAVRGGVITAIGKSLGKARRTVDARDCLVLPGAIDAHTHFQLPVAGTVSADGFETGSRAAALGGVTTFIDFATQDKGLKLKDVLDGRLKEAKGRSAVDYGLHCGITDWTKRTVAEIPKIMRRGVTSFKFFMVYEERGHMADDAMLLEALGEIGERGGLVTVHAENNSICRRLTERSLAAGKTGAEYLALSRPNIAEGEAITRAITLCEQVDGNLYIVHISSKEGAFAVASGRARGVNVLAETCPQYLLLEASKLQGKTGHHFATCPPLRSEIDNLALWEGIRNGDIEVIGTDHCAFTRKQKNTWDGDFTKVPYGLPGVETLLPLVFSDGYGRGLLSLQRLVQLLATNPALIFGLFPKKGIIQVGSDADLVVFDPKKKVRLSGKTLHMGSDYSPYEGRRISGWPTHTILRGKVIVDGGKYVGKAGDGCFLERQLPGEPCLS